MQRHTERTTESSHAWLFDEEAKSIVEYLQHHDGALLASWIVCFSGHERRPEMLLAPSIACSVAGRGVGTRRSPKLPVQ